MHMWDNTVEIKTYLPAYGTLAIMFILCGLFFLWLYYHIYVIKKFVKLRAYTRLIRLILRHNYYHTNVLQSVLDRNCVQTSTESMFWLSCEVLYKLDQKHMKQGCYIGNTTESRLQHSAFSPFSFLLFLFVLMDVPRPLSYFLSICAGAEGRSFAISCLCRTKGGRWGWRTRRNRRTENNTRGTCLTYLRSSWDVQWRFSP